MHYFQAKKVTNYDLLIRDYFLEHKTISLEKIGTLTLLEKNISPDHPAAANTLQFQVNKRAETTAGLIDYIAAQTHKNRVLVSSDLESHTELIRQFINIGRPYEIEGFGAFKIAKSGDYEFTPFDLSVQKKDESKTAKKQKPQPDSVLNVRKNSNKNVLMLFAMLIILAVLGVIGWGSYKLFFAKKEPAALKDSTAITNTATQALADTTTTIKDTVLKDSALVQTSAAANDSATYKAIIETTLSLLRAQTRTKGLISIGKPAAYDSVKRDSATVYHIYLTLKLNNKDTAMVRDTLQKFYQHKIKMIPAN